MRPETLDDFVGQPHLVGKNGPIRKAIANDRLFSMILWGPPGCGKTTLAGILARTISGHFASISAVLSGIKDIRSIIDEARHQQTFHRKKTILFVDEIHRFNKAQQDAFLYHVESGLIILIGATTENPSFEVIAPLLSRCRVFTLNALTPDDISMIIDRAIEDKVNGLGKFHFSLQADARDFLVRLSDGDARTALNNLELVTSLFTTGASKKDNEHRNRDDTTITVSHIETAIHRQALRYDKSGEEHYNLISAFHKSMRGSDPDAALYWLTRMLLAGEDPFYIARRMVRFASEDIGNADPYALRMALSAMEAFRFLGQPEGELSLAQAAVYLATAPKSNAIYAAYGQVRNVIEKSGSLPVPMHIRNAPTRMMKQMGYGKGYQYAHDYDDGYVAQDYLPESLKIRQYYYPKNRGYEKTIQQRLDYWKNHDIKKKE